MLTNTQSSSRNAMRQIQASKLQLGEIDIANITFNPRSRDDVPQLLRGLQYIYTQDDVRNEVFSLLEKMIPAKIDKNNGRPGMYLWSVLVMGLLRLNLNWNYDRLHEMVNEHKTIREMLGHGLYDEKRYSLQAIKNNAALLTPEIINDINEIVVKSGHKALKKSRKKTKPSMADAIRSSLKHT